MDNDSGDELDRKLLAEIQDQFVFFLPNEKYLLRDANTNEWLFDRMITRKSLETYLLSAKRYPKDAVSYVIKGSKYRTVEGLRVDPDAGPLIEVHGRKYINLYVRPTLQPTKGEYPRIHRTLDWITKDDAAGKAWLINWLAAKVQRPLFLPKVAVVINTKPGAGKGTLAKIMSQMLGPENTAEITARNLVNRFNERWIFKLFVLADEILTRDTMESTSENLKVLIDASKIELEKKGQDQRAVDNHLAWMFASNDEETPVVVEVGDRRYTVFSNFDPLPADYRDMVDSLYSPQTREPTAEFMAEISAFMFDLLALQVDFKAASRPYQNESRSMLMEANKTGHMQFIDYLREPGNLDDLLEHISIHDPHFKTRDTAHYDFGDKVGTQAIFRCYLAFCDMHNLRYRVKENIFGQAAARAGWVRSHPRSPVTGKQVYVYQGDWVRVPRANKKTFQVVEGGK